MKNNGSHRAALFMLLFVLILAPGKVLASGDSLLHLHYRDGELPLADVAFQIYKIGSLDREQKLQLEEGFRPYPIHLQGTKAAQWNECAQTLGAYVLRDQLPPTASGRTDGEGRLSWTLPAGVYLIVGEDAVRGNHKYRTSPFILALPALDGTQGPALHEVTALPKPEGEELPPGPSEETEIKVIKIWEDRGHGDERPASVKVALLENGAVREVVELSRENHWRHIWHELNPRSSWAVTEEGVDARTYEVLIREEEGIFTVVNSYRPPQEPPGEGDTERPPGKEPPSPPRIPQTGQDWWPVFVFAGAGVLSLALGHLQEIRKRKKGGKG
ncbi:MAG: Cna B-type domain-containing protein [Tissierellia bacterium]|nr:Cna B-type domain-containing protein [Tissierellia bacterium]